jgi:TPR repeat protein
LEKAVAAGDTTSMLGIGWLYADGRGVPQDYAKAREWYEKAAAKDNDDAMVNIGLLYGNGRGVPQDYMKAREWFEKAAAAIEAREVKNTGKPGAEMVRALGNIAWYALLAGEPARALAAGERALSLAPTELWIKTNYAHTLMFLGRAAEARELYLSQMDKIDPENNKPRQRVIAEDFAQFREAGLGHPMMAEIEAAFEAKR